MTDQAHPKHGLGAHLSRGLRGRCPRCGEAPLFSGFLKVTDRCATCGLGFAGHDAADGPAVLVMFLVGAVVMGGALVVEMRYAPPLWVHAVAWIPLATALCLGLLQPLKGATVALQYRFRSVEEPSQPERP